MLFFLLNEQLFGQQTHVITLEVNTSRLDKKDVNASCSFGQAPGISNEDYTIQVNKGDIIIWRGVSTNAPSTDVINIDAINHQGGVNVFGVNRLAGNNQDHETVSGVVRQGIPGDVDKYTLSFKVLINGKKFNGTFHIDPKIQVN
ncbi:MAG: hypothetical protein ABI844_19535 [Saprospiraceae bacterium]